MNEQDPTGRVTSREAAEHATLQSFLNCYLRETGAGEWVETEHGGYSLRLELPEQGFELLVPVRYRSSTGRHLFDRPIRYANSAGDPPELDYVTLIALLVRELSLAADSASGDSGELLLRVVDSCQNIERFVERYLLTPEKLYSFSTDFHRAEQALVFGHHLHPTPKSRQDFSPDELPLYSPELGGSFPLHYFRAHRSIVSEDSALAESASELVENELRRDPAVSEEFLRVNAEEGYSFVPVHPWQAEYLLRRPEVRALIESGELESLGPVGSPYHPTSSLRTVYRQESGYMLKLSLGVRITNSVRNNLRKELRRGLKVHRILQSAVGRELRERFPGFDFVRDPAYLTVETLGERELGFEVVLRENPFHSGEDVTPLIALCQDPLPGQDSRLGNIVRTLARRESRCTGEVSLEWFRHYLKLSLHPMLWLYFTHGLAPEAHQQNSLLQLREGYPCRFLYRDNQGYYFRAESREKLERELPGLHAAEDETIVPETVVEERLRYYFIFNNLFGLINAFGCAGLVEERALLTELRSHLQEWRLRAPEGSRFIPELLYKRKLPCKANLLTRFYEMDELAGSLEGQSVYVEVDNPLAQEVYVP